jgi:signal transduction histidine kinase
MQGEAVMKRYGLFIALAIGSSLRADSVAEVGQAREFMTTGVQSAFPAKPADAMHNDTALPTVVPLQRPSEIKPLPAAAAPDIQLDKFGMVTPARKSANATAMPAAVDVRDVAISDEAALDESFDKGKKPVKRRKRSAPTTTNQAPRATNNADYKERKQEVQQRLAQERASGGFTPGADEEVRQELAKRERAQQLVERAIGFFNEHTIEEACNAFTLTKQFVQGELNVFLFDIEGVCMADGAESTFLWRNLYNMRDRFGFMVVRGLVDVAKQGGGWVTYEWRNATKVSYVKRVEKGGKSYVIGCGFYPHSRSDAVVSMVRGAAAWFDKVKEEGRPPAEGFGDMDYPLGRFIDGSTYVFAYDDRGTLVAFGDLPTFVGMNQLDQKDEDGRYIVKEIIDRLSKESEAWFEFKQNRTRRRSFAKRVQDAEGKYYFIGSGYYPDINKDTVVDLVRRGYEFMKKSGKSQAVQAFNDPTENEFKIGDLYLVVYDEKGMCLANGRNAGFVGQNFFNTQDDAGEYYVRNIINQAKRGGGWVDARLNNSLWSVYVEEVDLGIERVVIASGIYPSTRRETMELMAKGAVSYLTANDSAQAFSAFSDRAGRFVRGDLEILVVSPIGYCYVYGIDLDVVWRNIINAKDDEGRQFIKLIINSTNEGPGTVKYRLNGAVKESYAEAVEKDGKRYIVASSMYM